MADKVTRLDKGHPGDPDFTPTEYFTPINYWCIGGSPVALDFRQSGAAILYLRYGSGADQPLGHNGDRFLTRILMVRIPPGVLDTWTGDSLSGPSCLVRIEGHFRGVRMVIEERDFYQHELLVDKVSFDHRFGLVLENPDYRFMPELTFESPKEDRPDRYAKQRKQAEKRSAKRDAWRREYDAIRDILRKYKGEVREDVLSAIAAEASSLASEDGESTGAVVAEPDADSGDRAVS